MVSPAPNVSSRDSVVPGPRYRRRTPTESVLYRIVYHCHEQLEWSWEGRFQKQYGAFRDEVRDALHAYLDCGVLAHGCSKARCTACQHTELIAFSCKARGICPSCAAKRAELFSEHCNDHVAAAVPHQHVVFTIPKRLRAFFRYDRALHRHLYASAWASIKESIPDGIPGVVCALHTAGESLSHHPHLHALVTAGGFDDDGTFHHHPVTDTTSLTRLFADAVCDALVDAKLLDREVADSILAQNHTGFSVWAGDEIQATDTKRVQFLARYLERAPLALTKLTTDGRAVTYRNAAGVVLWQGSPLDFLARLSVHIPDRWEATTRYFGYYAARTRGAREAQVKLASPDSPAVVLASTTDEPVSPVTSSWARLIKRVYEVDPLICTACGGTMRIVKFYTDPKEIAPLLKKHGLPSYRAPPPFLSC